MYFGSKESIEYGGDMAYLHSLSTYDSFSFPEQAIFFFYNTDEECKAARSLDVDHPSVVLYAN